jgi:serine/threonine-protein kinase
LRLGPTSIPDARDELKPGQTFLNGRYTVIRQIARSARATWLLHVKDEQLTREVVLEAVSQHDDFGRDLFTRKAASCLAPPAHPHIVATYDVVDAPPMGFIVREFVDGHQLSEVLRTSRLGLEQTLQIVLGVAAGLSAAHAAGVIHGHLAPSKVIVAANGIAKINGFRSPQPDRSFGFVEGTLDYMAPEQLTGNPVDERADVYSLGAVAFEMLTGTRAFRFVIGQPLMREPRHVRASMPECPPDLNDLISECTEPEPHRRPARMSDVHARIEQIQQQIGH